MDTKQQANTAPSLDATINCVVLRRLVEEVAAGELSTTRGYNRTHNRHNR